MIQRWAQVLSVSSLLGLSSLGGFGPEKAWAEDAVESISSMPASEGANSSRVAKKKKRVAKEREAEGSQAPNHFDQDLIIKSRYELNGQSLEVDTD